MQQKQQVRNLIFDFTGVYEQTPVNEQFLILNCTHIHGSRLYCSKQAKDKIKKMIHKYGIHGIHFLDSGDYHYITKFMTDEIRFPFSLVMFDHHTDMQEPLVEGMTSCGSWAAEVMEQNPYLQQLILIGQSIKTLRHCIWIHNPKVIAISYEELTKRKKAAQKFHKLRTNIPLYLSIDKDVLRRQDAVTNWNQGEMSFSMLEDLLLFLIHQCDIVGVDICGEYQQGSNLTEYLHAQKINYHLNNELYEFLKCQFQKRKRINPKKRFIDIP